MNKRLFIAYGLPADMKYELQIYCNSIMREINSNSIKWVKPENMHITIAFLGQVAENNMADIKMAIDKSGFIVSRISLGGINFYYRNNIPSVMYIEPQVSHNLGKYAHNIRSNLSDRGILFDSKAFKPHITLARIKNTKPLVSIDNIVNKKLDIKESAEYTIKNIILYESRFGANGLQYIQLYQR